jgi:type 2 lantibiotic biosynthesis protein LanM
MNGLAVPAAVPPLASGPIDWLEEASSLEDLILDHARKTPGGDVIWLHPASFRGESPKQVRIGWNLYDGVIGVALFLAALDRVEESDGRRQTILDTLAPLRRHLRQEREAARDPFPDLGGFTGLGGSIYAFSLLGRWLGEPELTADAAWLAALLTPARIAADTALDVMSGCAGAALALLALERTSPECSKGRETLRERAVACGEHLLSQRVASDGGPRAWAAKGLAPLCGFAHGAAGIACCLARLYERTGDSRFRDAAEEGVAFERLHYDPEHGNWPVLRAPGRPFMTSWCSGAPGVALGRLGTLPLATEAVRQDLRAALDTTAACSLLGIDSLCCGNLGRAEVLLQSHQVLGEERLRRAAEATASQAVRRSRDEGGRYRLPGHGDDGSAPFFFTGAAGIGYALLRLARPSLLPCVLALEVTE